MNIRLPLYIDHRFRSFVLTLSVCAIVSLQQFLPLYAGDVPVPAGEVDYRAYNHFLQKLVKRGGQGLNRVDYARVKKQLPKLNGIVMQMAKVRPSKLSANAQFAYWANLYNALTLKIVGEHYPVKSIKDISISPGLFSSGPWGKKIIKIEGRSMSLDDIEHQTLRKKFKTPLVHYSVNCASVGCPNLQKQAYTGPRLRAQLAQAARDFVNSPRGVVVKGHRVRVSKIYKWFVKDFGGSETNVLAHLRKYAASALKQKLSKEGLSLSYHYDWRLNNVR